MAFRRPLYFDASNDLREMDDTMIDGIRQWTLQSHAGSGLVGTTISFTASGGNLGTMTDNRLIAGVALTRVDRFPTSGETGDAANISINYSRMNQNTGIYSAVSDGGKKNFVYYDGNDIVAMTNTDMYDTIYSPAIDTFVSGNDIDGTYRIGTSASISGMTEMFGGPIFTDTRANVGAYTAGGIAETNDQPTTITNYYLHFVNSGYATNTSGYVNPVMIDSNNDLFVTDSVTVRDNILLPDMRYWVGQKVRYSINGSGNNRGSAMVDTRMNGSNYQTRFVNVNDYRAQEFPGGSATTVSTNHLRIRRI